MGQATAMTMRCPRSDLAPGSDTVIQLAEGLTGCHAGFVDPTTNQAESGVFRVESPRDLFRLVEGNFKELVDSPDDRHLINCIVLAHHLSDWVWKAWLEGKIDRQAVIGMSQTNQLSDFRMWLHQSCPDARVLKDLTNGTKHFEAPPPTRAGNIGVWSPLMIPRQEPGYLVKTDSGQWDVVFWNYNPNACILAKVADFWRRFLEEHAAWDGPA